MVESITNITLLVLGFGFVIFFHELGHFLAAKWCDVKVEQFAVGFGHAILSWRKGMGITWGSSGKRYEQILKAETEGVNRLDPTTIGETEYRLNWIPLGGYVKMLGQDDLRPNAIADDPRAYNKKSVGRRMIIVSAGVIMNIILAAIGFMVVFLMGFNAPPPVVGVVFPGSPAQNTRQVLPDGQPGAVKPLQAGDRLLMFDGKWQHDFTKIMLNTALAREGQPVLLYVKHPDGSAERMQITPRKADGSSKGFLALGIAPSPELQGPDKREQEASEYHSDKYQLPQSLLLKPGDTIVAINGQPVPTRKVKEGKEGKAGQEETDVAQYWRLDRAVQASNGRPVELTIRDARGQTRQASFQPIFQIPFNGQEVQFAGMQMRPRIQEVRPGSPAVGQVLPGDVVVRISDKDSDKSNPTNEELRNKLSEAGRNGTKVSLTVLRGDQEIPLPPILPSMRVGRDESGARYGLGVSLDSDELHPVVAGVSPNSPAQHADIPPGGRIVSVDAQPVENWFDVKQALAKATPDRPVTVVVESEGKSEEHKLTLNAEQIATIASYDLTSRLALHELVEPRKTSNPAVAMQWGVIETRDFVLQFYLTIQRMFQGSVSYKNMMGPVGIFSAGTHFAYKGMDWLIWFLAMISANLAVVNFLPIPIVDGGLFTFLIIEKIQGRPLSARTQSIAQIVGLAVILGVFLLVTYQDIARIGGY